MVGRRKNIVSFLSLAQMSISTYLMPNIHQNSLEILGVNIFLHCFAGGDDINNVRGTNRRG
jgi:hypothetical protein